MPKIRYISVLPMASTVKARRKYGANSLDITIPAALCRNLDIKAGDIFELKYEEKDGKITFAYTKVYKYR